MYHYKESGLPYIFLENGYKEIATVNGKSVAIRDVEGLHFAIATAAILERKHLTGPEVKFVRKFLELTQCQFAELLGVEEQTVRLWEKRPRAPKQADRAVRLSFLNIVGMNRAKPAKLADIVKRTTARDEVSKLNLRFRPSAKDKWTSDLPKAA